MSNLVAVPLPDGRWLALEPDVLRDGLDAAQSLGLGPAASPALPAVPGGAVERWLTSEQLQELTQINSTNWEARAAAGKVPFRRVGRLLRFKLSEVEAALKDDA